MCDGLGRVGIGQRFQFRFRFGGTPACWLAGPSVIRGCEGCMRSHRAFIGPSEKHIASTGCSRCRLSYLFAVALRPPSPRALLTCASKRGGESRELRVGFTETLHPVSPHDPAHRDVLDDDSAVFFLSSWPSYRPPGLPKMHVGHFGVQLCAMRRQGDEALVQKALA